MGNSSQSEKKLKIEKERSGAKEVKTRKPSASSKEVASKDKKTEIRKKEKPKAAIFPDFDEDSLVNSNPVTFATLSGDFGESVAEIKRHMTLMIKYKKEASTTVNRISSCGQRGACKLPF